MLLTLTLHSDDPETPATELGHLLHKHPDKCQRFDLAFGAVHVFYPEATAARCTAALLLDVDPVGLARSRNSRSVVPAFFLSIICAGLVLL